MLKLKHNVALAIAAVGGYSAATLGFIGSSYAAECEQRIVIREGCAVSAIYRSKNLVGFYWNVSSSCESNLNIRHNQMDRVTNKMNERTLLISRNSTIADVSGPPNCGPFFIGIDEKTPVSGMPQEQSIALNHDIVVCNGSATIKDVRYYKSRNQIVFRISSTDPVIPERVISTTVEPLTKFFQPLRSPSAERL